MSSSKKKSLPDFSEMKKRRGKNHTAEYLRKDPEVSKWLLDMFNWKDSGQLHTSHEEIAEELSEYSGLDIKGDHISRAFRSWKKSGKY
jgi:hypothetical protein